MTFRRVGAFCMAVLTVLFVIACIPDISLAASGAQNSEDTLPLSLTGSAGDRMYFLPAYDAATCFNPARRVYVLPTVSEADEGQKLSGFPIICEECGQAAELYCTESITPRAP